MEYKDLLRIKNNLVNFVDGIDPQSGLYVGNDSILSSRFNQSVLKETICIIDKIIKYGVNLDRIDNRRKYSFYLEEDTIRKINISEEPISISKFTHKINEYVNNDTMKKLKATILTNWLLSNDYLTEKEIDDKMTKLPTEKGKSLGITSKKKTSKYGNNYFVNLYDSNAQKFLLNNIDKIVEIKVLDIL